MERLKVQDELSPILFGEDTKKTDEIRHLDTPAMFRNGSYSDHEIPGRGHTSVDLGGKQQIWAFFWASLQQISVISL